MPTIPEEKIAEIRDRLSIERLVGRSVDLKRQGQRFSGRCPFHDDRSPSFSVDPIKKLFYCFGCGAGGDVFDFVQRIDGLDFPEAIRVLAKETGVILPEREETPNERRRRHERNQMYELNQQAQRFFEGALQGAPRALAYLRQERGLSDETIKKARLGFAPNGWEALSDFLRSQKAPLEVAAELGLLGQRKQGGGFYDRLRGKIVFPIALPGGEISGFGARRADWLIEDGDKGPKYLNSPESPVYDKSTIFYGLDRARDAIRRSHRAILVEGYFDVIALQQGGIENAVACCGTSLSLRHAKALSKLADEVVTLYDGDAAGVAATQRAAEALLRAGLSVRVLRLLENDDPDTFIQREGAATLERLVEESPSALDSTLADAIRRHSGAGVAGLIKIVEAIRPLLRAVPDRGARDLMVEGAAQRLRVSPEVLRRHLRGAVPSRPTAPERREPPPRPAKDIPPAPLELGLVRLLVDQQATVLEALRSRDAMDAPTHPAVRAVLQAAQDADTSGEPFDAARALAVAKATDMGANTLAALQRALMETLPEAEDVTTCVLRLKDKQARRQLRALRLRILEERDPAVVAELSTELKKAVEARASVS